MPAPSHRYDPYLYSLVHRGNPGDEAFYANLAEGQDVLELGCGAGRILRSMHACARSAVGLELDPAFVEQARSTLADVEVEIRQGDMAALDLTDRFDLIVAPYSALYCLAGDGALAACFAGVASHLRPGGRFVFDVWGADAFHLHFPEDEYPQGEFEPLTTVVDNDTRYEISEASVWNRDAQQVKARYRYAFGEQIEEAQLTHHYRLSDQFRSQLEGAGLSVTRMNGGFATGSYQEEDPLLVVEAVVTGDRP